MKGKLNFIIDTLMFLLMSVVAGLGFLMKYVLVPGKDRLAKFGRQVDLYFLNWDRHEWGTLHLILGYVLLGLLVLHIVLHWKSIQCLYRRLIMKKAWRIPVTIVFSLISLFLLFFPFIVPIEVEETKPGQGHHGVIHPALPDSTGEHAEKGAVASDTIPERYGLNDRRNNRIEIQGFMTLQQVSDQYHIPADAILSGLNIADTILPGETLGRLKKKYSFRMTDVENIIRNCGNNLRE